MTNAAEPVSPTDAAQRCFTTWLRGYALLLPIHPSKGNNGAMSKSTCLKLCSRSLTQAPVLWKKHLVEPPFPHLLHINHAHSASTGSLRAKGKPTGLRAPINQVWGINSLLMGCARADLLNNPARSWTNNSWYLTRHLTTTLTSTSAVLFDLLFFLKEFYRETQSPDSSLPVAGLIPYNL